MRAISMLVVCAWLALFAVACEPAGQKAGEKAAPAASAAALASALIAAPPPAAPLRIGVTLHPYYSWTKNVVGDAPGVEVRPILPGDVDAGNYQPRPEDIKKLSDLDALVVNGIGHDDFITGMIKASGNERLTLIRPNDGAPQLPSIHGGAVNSHTFISFTNAILQTYAIERALGALRPELAAGFRKGASAYAERLRKIKADAARRLVGARITRVVTVHDGYSYLCQEFGVEVAGVVEPAHGLIPSAAELGQMVDLDQAREDPRRAQRGELPRQAAPGAARRDGRAGLRDLAHRLRRVHRRQVREGDGEERGHARRRADLGRRRGRARPGGEAPGAMTDPPLLEVSDLTLMREGRPIVLCASLRVARGAIHVIVGPNGGGKSSLLEAILGQASFTGSVRCHFRGSGRVGYVPQSFPVDATLPVTVAELLALSRQRLPVCLGVRREVRATVERLLDRVGLAGLAGRRLGALSGGELRRVLLANAMDPPPELLVLDEPGSGLDAASVTRLEEIVRALRDEHGATVLMVSHDHDQVRRLATAVTWIDRTVRRDGPLGPDGDFRPPADEGAR